MTKRWFWILIAGRVLACAQDPTVDLQTLKPPPASLGVGTIPDTTPRKDKRGGEGAGGDQGRTRTDDPHRLASEEERLDAEVRELKKRESGKRRFAADLFEVRQRGTGATEGGVAEDYLLGTGDQLNLNVFGSATFDLPIQVDGRGEVVIPKVGVVKIAGKTLGQARSAVHGLVSQNFSKVSVDLQVTKLREVRVFVLGEVYRPGAYLVPSLSSIVNVLSLAGGPTAIGSYRQVRVVRGGKVVHTLDLYPLRAEGLGNMNFSLQSGDTLFVPLSFNQVLLEGGFVRVGHGGSPAGRGLGSGISGDDGSTPVKQSAPPSVGSGEPRSRKEEPEDMDRERSTALNRSMYFELLPGETALEAFHFAGGLLPDAFGETLTLRRKDRNGIINVEDIPTSRLGNVVLQRGDVLSALPRRDQVSRVVTVVGWVRVPGAYARMDGLRVGDLLRREQQILPDTYLERGEIVRTLPDGSTKFLAFHVGKAAAGDADHNLPLENRDRVELFKTERMRLPKDVSISGPVTRAGKYEFHEGMRVADLIFRAGIPQKSANRLVAELARSRYGQPSEVRQLDLAKLVSTETGSPVHLPDDAVNPLLQPDDQISLFEKPEFRVHRVVKVSGQVARPGSYALDADKSSLFQLIQRAGGLTPQAMPAGGIFLRRLGAADEALKAGAGASGVGGDDPTAKGIEDILERLSEKRLIVEKGEARNAAATLFKPPIFHGLANAKLNRMVVNFQEALSGKADMDVELQDGDEVIIPRQTESALVIGETASPFAFYKVQDGMKVADLLRMAGGTTRNADNWNIRLLKADGRIVDHRVKGQAIEPGDAVLVPQRIRRDSSWQENLTALTPLAILINALRN